jgi:predicted small secreted protein
MLHCKPTRLLGAAILLVAALGLAACVTGRGTHGGGIDNVEVQGETRVRAQGYG